MGGVPCCKDPSYRRCIVPELQVNQCFPGTSCCTDDDCTAKPNQRCSAPGGECVCKLGEWHGGVG